MSLRSLTPEEATRIVALALQACCLPPGVGAAVVVAAPVLVGALADALERHEAGEPLPAVVWSQAPSLSTAIDEELERAMGRP